MAIKEKNLNTERKIQPMQLNIKECSRKHPTLAQNQSMFANY